MNEINEIFASLALTALALLTIALTKLGLATLFKSVRFQAWLTELSCGEAWSRRMYKSVLELLNFFRMREGKLLKEFSK